MQYHILVVDDDVSICSLLKEYLNSNGYIVSAACNIDESEGLLQYFKIDLIILDLMLGNESGMELISRNKPNIPVVMLSALGDVDDRINGLQNGADDYIAKPFEPKELLLRMQKLLQRQAVDANVMVFGEYRFHLSSNALYNGTQHIHLTTLESRLLHVLIENSGKVISRDSLLTALEQTNIRYIDLCIARLRNKIEKNPKAPQFLQTVRGRGYVFYTD